MESITIEKPLELASAKVVKEELQMIEPEKLESKQASPELIRQADDLVQRLLKIDTRDLKEQHGHTQAIQSLGGKVERELARKSVLLKEPMQKLVKDAEDGGSVAKSLLDLQERVSQINPNRINFDMGGIRRLLAKVPGIGTPLSRWFARYQSVESVMGDIVKSLKDGRARLERDNVTLKEDQMEMRELTFRLQDYIRFGQLLNERLGNAISTGQMDQEQRRFLEEEILFSVRQRILDLQQQLAVYQQGVLTTETIIRNNRELIRGVSRSLGVTITALQTAATLAVALQHQKRVLKGVQAVTETTNDLIVQTSEQLKTQGVEIQKQASSTALDIEKLRTAFRNVESALEEITNFRREALPQMAQSIVEMDGLSRTMDKTIQKMEKGTEVKQELAIELED
jgi:uncharacterized protein YaaN involved in tellurite resistance